MNVTFAFSGSCHSGKSTLIEKIKAQFGPRIWCVDECIRDMMPKGVSIDQLRSDPDDCFALQKRAILKKIQLEDESRAKAGKLVLVDRSLADSLYYLTSHLNAKLLSPHLQEEYLDFVRTVISVARQPHRYSNVFIFKPIPPGKSKGVDLYRPTDLAAAQDREYAMIDVLNRGLFSGLADLVWVDVLTEENSVLQLCDEAIFEL